MTNAIMLEGISKEDLKGLLRECFSEELEDIKKAVLIGARIRKSEAKKILGIQNDRTFNKLVTEGKVNEIKLSANSHALYDKAEIVKYSKTYRKYSR